jgi:putative endonuclease
MPSPSHRASRGRQAEEAAASYLERSGFVVLGRNVRIGRDEIDLVVRSGELVVIVEVRTRGPGSWLKALASVDRAKRARLRRAGDALWRSRFKRDPSIARMRFDVVAVDLDAADGPQIEHVRAAL